MCSRSRVNSSVRESTNSRGSTDDELWVGAERYIAVFGATHDLSSAKDVNLCSSRVKPLVNHCLNVTPFGPPS